MSGTPGQRADRRWRSIGGLVGGAGELHGSAEAVRDREVSLSFAELAEQVARAARATIAAGVGPRDRVAIWAPNSVEWMIAALGAVSAGAVLVPLNTRYQGAEAADILDRSGARLLLTVRGFLDTDYVAMLRGTGVALPELRQIVLLQGPAGEGAGSFEEHVAAGADVEPAEALARREALGPDDVSDLIYTSGTSGRPKGVLCTHGQTLRVFEVWADVVGLRAGDRYLVVNPFFHTFGYKAGVIACLLTGATVLPEAVFDAPRVLSRVARERVTVLPGPPTLFSSLLAVPGRAAADTASLRLAVTGAAVVRVELVRRVRAELGVETVLTAYGLTEATGVVTMCRRGDDDELVAGTSGRAIPDTEVAVVDAEGTSLPPGTPGEVVTRGYHVTRGYVDDPVATAAAVDPAGWLHTGDVGVLDAAGNLAITDRLKDMYVVGGFNAYPAEVERVLATYPGVADVAVVGIPDERLGEVGAAFVVPAAGAALDTAALLAWARERLAGFKVPRSVVLLDALPRNAGGKVVKFQLREGISS